MSSTLETFATRLRHLREEKNLRQADVAIDLNVTRQTISKYERAEREPDFYMLCKIADYYKVSIDYLLGRTTSTLVNYMDDKVSTWFWPMKVADRPGRR